MARQNRVPQEVRERAVGMVADHRGGVQYVSIRHMERLTESGIKPSAGSVGDSYGNTMAETIFDLLKAEVVWPNGPWRSLEEVEVAALKRVEWFNNRRLLEPIGDIPPAEFEAMHYERLESPAKNGG